MTAPPVKRQRQSSPPAPAQVELPGPAPGPVLGMGVGVGVGKGAEVGSEAVFRMGQGVRGGVEAELVNEEGGG